MRSISILLLAVTCGVAQEPQKKDTKSPAALIKIRVKVVDPEGEPLEGAVVTPSGLRAQVNPGTHYFWMEQLHGVIPKATTNADGIADLGYPEFVTEGVATGQVTWSVDHEDYVLFREDRSVGGELAELKLKSGYRIATTAIDANTKEAIKADLYAVVSGDWGSNWKLRKGGVLTSRVFDRNQTSMRVIHLPKDGPALFSELKQVSPEEGQGRVFLRNVELKRGTAVSGMLDESVPRPVTNGKVCVVVVVPGLRGPDAGPNGRLPAWNWAASAKVKPDGSFRLDSLPTGDVVQVIAVCDGWVSKNPDDPKLKEKFPGLVTRDISPRMRWPQLFELEAEEIKPTITMEKTATCEVTVQDPDGNPVVGARVAMWPNQIFFAWGSQILGTEFDFVKMLRKTREGVDVLKTVRDQESDYNVQTNDDGIATIKNLPAPGNQGIVIMHDKFAGPGPGATNVTLTPAETATVTIKLESKDTETDDGDE